MKKTALFTLLISSGLAYGATSADYSQAYKDMAKSAAKEAGKEIWNQILALEQEGRETTEGNKKNMAGLVQAVCVEKQEAEKPWYILSVVRQGTGYGWDNDQENIPDGWRIEHHMDGQNNGPGSYYVCKQNGVETSRGQISCSYEHNFLPDNGRWLSVFKRDVFLCTYKEP